MRFSGVWATESGSAAFRVVPKCACSTIGQLLYFSDHGRYYEGDIHSPDVELLKWGNKAHRPRIAEIVMSSDSHTFTCVRNPYTRILSAFFDKVAGTQANGTRYRSGEIHSKLHAYGVDLEEGFDQIRSFRQFLLFARDTIKFGTPMESDIHWSPVFKHLFALVHNGGSYDAVISTESLPDGISQVFSRIESTYEIDPRAIPRFNEGGSRGPKRAFPVEDYFDDFSIRLMRDVYDTDFRLFRYDQMPGTGGPREAIDLERVNRELSV